MCALQFVNKNALRATLHTSKRSHLDSKWGEKLASVTIGLVFLPLLLLQLNKCNQCNLCTYVLLCLPVNFRRSYTHIV